MRDLITLEILKTDYLGDWDNDWDRWAVRQITLASAWLRSFFKQSDRDLDQEILDGVLEEALVESAVSQMILRKLNQSVQMPFGGMFQSYTEQAGPYSKGITLPSNDSNFFLRKDMRRQLGFKQIGFASIPIEI